MLAAATAGNIAGQDADGCSGRFLALTGPYLVTFGLLFIEYRAFVYVYNHYPWLGYQRWLTQLDQFRWHLAIISLGVVSLEIVSGVLRRTVIALRNTAEWCIERWRTRSERKAERTRDEQWLLSALQHYKAEVRWAAARRLAALKVHIPSEVLIRCLEDKDFRVRAWAVEILGDQKDHRRVEWLIHSLRDRSKIVRSAAVVELSKIGGTEAEQSLVYALQDRDTEVQRAVIAALRHLRVKNAVGPLESLLKKCIFPREIFGALTTIDKAAARSAAIDILTHVNISGPYSNFPWRSEETKSQPPLSHPGWQLREAAAQKLADFDGPRAVPYLQKAVEDGSVEAAVVAGRMLRGRAVSWLSQLTHNRRVVTRTAAAIGLGATNDERAVPRLTHLFRRDSKLSVRQGAAIALSSIDLSSSGDVIFSALSDESLEEIAVRALTVQPNTFTIRRFLEKICDPCMKLEERKQKADVLARIYRSGSLSDKQESMLLSTKECIVDESHSHTDVDGGYDHTDVDGYGRYPDGEWGQMHRDYSGDWEGHEDTYHRDGINLPTYLGIVT